MGDDYRDVARVVGPGALTGVQATRQDAEVTYEHDDDRCDRCSAKRTRLAGDGCASQW